MNVGSTDAEQHCVISEDDQPKAEVYGSSAGIVTLYTIDAITGEQCVTELSHDEALKLHAAFTAALQFRA